MGTALAGRVASAAGGALAGMIRAVQCIMYEEPFSRLTAGDKLVLLAIAEHLQALDGHAWPSMSRLAKARGSCVRRARSSVARLIAAGWITADGRTGGRNCSTRYRLSVKTRTLVSAFMAEKPGQQRPPLKSETRTLPSVLDNKNPDTSDQNPDTSVRKPGQQRPPNRIEPPENPQEEEEEEASTRDLASTTTTADGYTIQNKSNLTVAMLQLICHVPPVEIPAWEHLLATEEHSSLRKVIGLCRKERVAKGLRPRPCLSDVSEAIREYREWKRERTRPGTLLG